MVAVYVCVDGVKRVALAVATSRRDGRREKRRKNGVNGYDDGWGVGGGAQKKVQGADASVSEVLLGGKTAHAN